MSICDTRLDNKGNPLLIATGIPVVHVIYPVVPVQVEGIKCRALLDSGAGRSYTSAKLLDRLSSHRIKKEVRKIEMMLGATREVELLTIDISATDGKFCLTVEVTKVNKGELLFPMDDLDTKDQLPVHLILGAGEYGKIKTECSYSKSTRTACHKINKLWMGSHFAGKGTH